MSAIRLRPALWLPMAVRPTLALWLAVVASPAIAATQATDSALPALPAAGPTIESLVPAGWTIERRHRADFNRDGRADVLLLLRDGTAHGPRDGSAQSTTPRRILLVALATAKPRGYARAAANAQLIPRDPSGAVEDPMADGEITVRPRGFELKIGMMPGVGSYLAATMRFRFRLEGECVRLIGYDRNETHRGTLDTRDVSVNFLTGEVIHRTGNAESKKADTRGSRLTANPRRCLPDVPNGWTFDPTAAAPPNR